MMPICAKQQGATFEAQFVNKLCNIVADLKKKALLVKNCVFIFE